MRIISAAAIEDSDVVYASPDDHFTAGPHCRVDPSGNGRGSGAGGDPRVGNRIVSPARIEISTAESTPYNHFTAGPDRRVLVSAIWRVGGAGSSPRVRAASGCRGGVTRAAVVISAADDPL